MKEKKGVTEYGLIRDELREARKDRFFFYSATLVILSICILFCYIGLSSNHKKILTQLDNLQKQVVELKQDEPAVEEVAEKKGDSFEHELDVISEKLEQIQLDVQALMYAKKQPGKE